MPKDIVRNKPLAQPATLRGIIKQFIPPKALNLVKKILSDDLVFEVGYKSWEDAEKASKGYDADNVIDKVVRSAKLVFDGKAIFERDSVIFDEIEYSWPLLASLLFVAANNRSLRVIDFGGGLGTTFQQNRRFLTNLPNRCEWRIVEQPKFVDIGKKDFTNSYLSFYNTIEEAAQDGVDAVLFGDSICYVANPYHILNAAIATNASYIIFDRTPITADTEDTFAVQHVPPSIYKASYPIRNFNYNNLIEPLEQKYELVEEWRCDLQPDPQTTATGFIFKLRSQ